MKRLVLMIMPALICGVMFTSCSADIAGTEAECTFSGACYVTFLSSEYIPYHVPITIKFKNGKYTMIDFLHEQANISGKYIINNDKIIFENTIWETDYIDKNGIILAFDFDAFLVPQGECNYTIDGEKLILSRTIDDFAHYEWNLEKSK